MKKSRENSMWVRLGTLPDHYQTTIRCVPEDEVKVKEWGTSVGPVLIENEMVNELVKQAWELLLLSVFRSLYLIKLIDLAREGDTSRGIQFRASLRFRAI